MAWIFTVALCAPYGSFRQAAAGPGGWNAELARLRGREPGADSGGGGLDRYKTTFKNVVLARAEKQFITARRARAKSFSLRTLRTHAGT